MYKISPSPNYLVRNSYSYCFRIKVPKDIQLIITLKELRYSLKTGNLSDAKNKARYLAGQVQQLFRDIQNGCLEDMNLSKEQIQNMVKAFLKERIEKYNQPMAYKGYFDEWSDDDEWNPSWRDEDEHPKHSSTPFSDQEGLEETIEVIDEIKADLNLKLQKGSYGMAAKRADRLLAEEGFTEYDIDRTSPSYTELCSGIYRAWIKSLDYWQQKLKGKYNDNLERVMEDFLSGETSVKSREHHKKTDTTPDNSPPLIFVLTQVESQTISKPQISDSELDEVRRLHPNHHHHRLHTLYHS